MEKALCLITWLAKARAKANWSDYVGEELGEYSSLNNERRRYNYTKRCDTIKKPRFKQLFSIQFWLPRLSWGILSHYLTVSVFTDAGLHLEGLPQITSQSSIIVNKRQSGKTNHFESHYLSPWLQQISKLKQTTMLEWSRNTIIR